MIPVDPPTHQLIKRFLRTRPFTFLHPVYFPNLRAAYETGVDGVVLVYVDYGHLALRGVVIIQEPDMQIYLDFHSIHQMVETMIENAITAYDMEKQKEVNTQ